MTTATTRERVLWLPWLPILITAAVAISALFAVQPVRDAVRITDAAEAYLTRPAGYVLIAPLSAVLDTVTLLSVRQHLALFIGLLTVFVLWRTAPRVLQRVRRRKRGAEGERDHSLVILRGTEVRRSLVGFAVLMIAIVVLYVSVVLLPRPMAALVVNDAHILIVDFHSHTSASSDGRSGWTVEDNRNWHRDAGYDVAYVTDHRTVEAAERGMAHNPNPAATGVTLLQGIEVGWQGEHVTILGAQRTYMGILDDRLRDVDLDGLVLASLIPGREPVVIWNHPRTLGSLPLHAGPRTAGVRAIELVNGAPQTLRASPERAQLVELAEQYDVPLTAGSDNHGWGRTAPGWTLMRIRGWRGTYGDALASQIERTLRTAGFTATRVVERRVADPGHSRVALAFTLIAVPARMLTTLSAEERVAWILWIWLLAAAVWFVRQRRRRSAA